jgi:hypothetical protein
MTLPGTGGNLSMPINPKAVGASTLKKYIRLHSKALKRGQFLTA